MNLLSSAIVIIGSILFCKWVMFRDSNVSGIGSAVIGILIGLIILCVFSFLDFTSDKTEFKSPYTEDGRNGLTEKPARVKFIKDNGDGTGVYEVVFTDTIGGLSDSALKALKETPKGTTVRIEGKLDVVK